MLIALLGSPEVVTRQAMRHGCLSTGIEPCSAECQLSMCPFAETINSNMLCVQIFIGNIAHTCTRDEIRRFCEKVAPLYHLHVPAPKSEGANNPGYAFAMYHTRVAAAEAIETMAGSTMPSGPNRRLVCIHLMLPCLYLPWAAQDHALHGYLLQTLRNHASLPVCWHSVSQELM
jgi:RNA recognition motif-containing protein